MIHWFIGFVARVWVSGSLNFFREPSSRNYLENLNLAYVWGCFKSNRCSRMSHWSLCLRSQIFALWALANSCLTSFWHFSPCLPRSQHFHLLFTSNPLTARHRFPYKAQKQVAKVCNDVFRKRPPRIRRSQSADCSKNFVATTTLSGSVATIIHFALFVVIRLWTRRRAWEGSKNLLRSLTFGSSR